MFRKIFVVIFLVILFGIFGFFQKDEYLNHIKENKEYKENLILLDKKLENFSLEKIDKLENIDFYYTPYKNLIDKIIQKIDNAKNKVYLEVYMFTENKRFPNALVRAKKRGVEVKVILEKNPYKTPNINNKIFEFLKKNGIEVVWSNPGNYSLNHSKFFIIDDEIILSTGNLTYSTFAFNRDFFLFIKDKKQRQDLEKLFLSDFSGKKRVVYNDNLVVSPEYSKVKFKKIFEKAKKSLKMYFQYLEDDDLEKFLIKKAKNILVEIVVSENFYKKNKEKINFLEKNNIKIVLLKKCKMHAKAILVDDKFLFIGSENFSYYSLEKNREVGIIFKDKEVIKKYLEVFNMDFKKR